MPVRTEAVMGTLVTIQAENPEAEAVLDRAFGWFHYVEARCTRFDPHSELMQLSTQVGVAVPVSDVLYEAVRFAVAVAEESRGAFDPTVGHEMETRGFNTEHRTGETVRSEGIPSAPVSYRDIQLDDERRTITLLRPLLLDLGAVAKGLAVDAASRELAPLADFLIDAGGDLYLGGSNPTGAPWSVGIRHPRNERECIDRLRVSNAAVCTSGDYERTNDARGHHILDPRNNVPACTAASATVLAPTAMLVDALATAAFVLGPAEGIPFLERFGVEGLIITPQLERYETKGWARAR